MSRRYELLLSSRARRALETSLPTAVALAIWAFCDGELRDAPLRFGKPLRGELTGYHSARRGGYRVLYQIVEDDRAVHVVRIDHRAHVSCRE